MEIGYALGTMGDGKTLFATHYALKYNKLNPDNTIYANYHLNIKNFVYTPYMFMPLDNLHNSLVICEYKRFYCCYGCSFKKE